HELAVLLARAVARRLPIATHQARDDALELHPPGAVALGSFFAPGDGDLLAFEAVEDLIALLLRELLPRGVERDLAGLGHRVGDPEGPAAAALHRRGPGRDRAVSEREV